MGEQPKPTVEDVARNCPSTCMFPFYIWGLVDTTSPSCRGCKEVAEAIERGEVSVPSAELVNKVRSIMEEKIRKGEPALLVISPVISADFDEHGNIVYKGIEGICPVSPHLASTTHLTLQRSTPSGLCPHSRGVIDPAHGAGSWTPAFIAFRSGEGSKHKQSWGLKNLKPQQIGEVVR